MGQPIAEGDMHSGDIVENRTFDEIAISESTGLSRTPAEKIRRARVALPDDKLRWYDRYQYLISLCAGLQPIPTAVVHPCDQTSLEGAVRSAEARLVVAVLVGPRRTSPCSRSGSGEHAR
jgi:hypothetical protein